MTFPFFFLIVALILFALAALNVSSPKFSLGWAGMFFVTMAYLWPLLPH